MEESKKRPREEPVATEKAGKVPKVEEKKKFEVVVAEWKAKVVKALTENGWEGCKKLLDEVVERCGKAGEPEHESPQVVHALYGEIAEMAQDDVVEHLVDYMLQPVVVALAHKKRYIPFLNPILFATHNITAKRNIPPYVVGKAQLFPAVLSCIRQDVTILPQKSTITQPEPLHYELTAELDSCLPEILKRLRSNHKMPVPDEAQFLKDIKELQTKSSTMISAIKEADAIQPFASEVEALISRLLKAINTSAKDCKHIGETYQKEALEGPSVAPMPEGQWSTVKLQGEGYKLYVYMLMCTLVGHVMFRCLNEVCVVRSAAAKKPFELAASRMKAVRSNILKGISGTTGLGGKQLAESVLKEFWRDSVWYTWKLLGCPRQAFEGAEAAATELQSRSSSSKTRGKPFTHPERQCCNTVSLPRPSRASTTGYPKGFTSPKSTSFGNDYWIHRHAFVSAPSDEYIKNTLPVHPPTPKPQELSSYPSTLVGGYQASRLRAATNIKQAVEN
eukprot:TRINITY_DN8145_c0_g1_i1.p1 TRINITY_DN8145_c0_g1~~TRINITY_DN8145_c0_g1_i1.p1  ORF type:complete len:519 (+),score=108.89 TRINITY_DN8145_c0_g1_i1:44-1558(+)